jgi:hypothetical protein
MRIFPAISLSWLSYEWATFWSDATGNTDAGYPVFPSTMPCLPACTSCACCWIRVARHFLSEAARLLRLGGPREEHVSIHPDKAVVLVRLECTQKFRIAGRIPSAIGIRNSEVVENGLPMVLWISSDIRRLWKICMLQFVSWGTRSGVTGCWLKFYPQKIFASFYTRLAFP